MNTLYTKMWSKSRWWYSRHQHRNLRDSHIFIDFTLCGSSYSAFRLSLVFLRMLQRVRWVEWIEIVGFVRFNDLDVLLQFAWKWASNHFQVSVFGLDCAWILSGTYPSVCFCFIAWMTHNLNAFRLIVRTHVLELFSTCRSRQMCGRKAVTLDPK